MIILFVELMAGYAIGKFMPKGNAAYAACIPASLVSYTLIKYLVADLPEIEFLVLIGILYSPLLMLGVFLARRHSRRNSFGTDV